MDKRLETKPTEERCWNSNEYKLQNEFFKVVLQSAITEFFHSSVQPKWLQIKLRLRLNTLH